MDPQIQHGACALETEALRDLPGVDQLVTLGVEGHEILAPVVLPPLPERVLSLTGS
jgi:hypothetical protein